MRHSLPGPDAKGATGAVTQGEGATSASEGGIAVAGSVLESILYICQAPPGRPALSEKDFRRILGEYLRWVCNAYSKARLYGLERGRR